MGRTYEDETLAALCSRLNGLGRLQAYSAYVTVGSGGLQKRAAPAPTDGPIWYGNLEAIGPNGEVKWHCLVMPRFMSFSDYSGGTLERSNCEVFLNKFGGTQGVYELSGGYGTKGVAILLSSVTEEMIEEFTSLSDYPLLDDEHHTNLEMQLETEDWDSWIRGDFSRALGKRFPHLEDTIEQMASSEPDELFKLYHTLCERTSTTWCPESAVGGYVGIDRLVEGAVEGDFKKAGE